MIEINKLICNMVSVSKGISFKPELFQVSEKSLNDGNESLDLLKAEDMDLKFYSKYRNVIETSKKNVQNAPIKINDESKEKQFNYLEILT